MTLSVSLTARTPASSRFSSDGSVDAFSADAPVAVPASATSPVFIVSSSFTIISSCITGVTVRSIGG